MCIESIYRNALNNSTLVFPVLSFQAGGTKLERLKINIPKGNIEL